jgi:hypothetical protein
MDEISKKNTKSKITLRTKQNEKSEKDLNKLSLQDLENSEEKTDKSRTDKKDNDEDKDKAKDKAKVKPSLEDNFEFNEETINFFTKDLYPNKILIKHPTYSSFLEKINDTILICLLIKIGHFKDYHCTTSKCKVGKLWNGKPIQLILNRKNSIQNDLTITNLELICANCYMVTYGLDIFIKKKKEIILTCTFCDFPLVTFKDSRKKKGVCLACESKMKQISHNKQEDNYFNKLKDTYSDNPVLSDDVKPMSSSSYSSSYNEVSKYNGLNTQPKKHISSINNVNVSNNTQQPIIELNMNIPDLSELINDD